MSASVKRIAVILTIGLIAACASATPAAAQSTFAGSFTLPNEVRWANATLPAGDYTFKMDSAALPARVFLSGPNGNVIVLTSNTDKRAADGPSSLTIERRGGARFVSDVYLADLGLHLRYAMPKAPKDQEIAQGPATTEQVLLAMATK
jgi:hypothetical protein